MFRPGLRCVSLVAFEQPAEPFSAGYQTFAIPGTYLGQNEPIGQTLVISFPVIMLDKLADSPT